MNDEYSYVGVPTTTQEAMAKEEHDHPIESSEAHTLARPEVSVAPKLSASTLEWKSLITPIGTLIFGAVLALGHHAFNAWEAGRPVAKGVVPQNWVTRIGVGFSFGFKSAVGVTMAFVLLQCLWLSVARQPLTIQQIDTMYQIERRDHLYTLPQALFFSPTIVVFSVLTLLLPLSGVFAPGSLTVTTNNSTDVGPCMIPTGYLSTPGTPDYASLYKNDSSTYSINGSAFIHPFSPSPRANGLTMKWFVEQHIPDLPQSCGPNCRYKVHVPSFVFQCTPNPSSLPYAQEGNKPFMTTLWNATNTLNASWVFYIAWQSNSPDGTSGNASCLPFFAQYDVEVQTKGGAQSVTTNVTQIISPIPDPINPTFFSNISSDMFNFRLQVTALAYATQKLFLGDAVLNSTALQLTNSSTALTNNWPDGLPSFLELRVGSDPSDTQFIWGDVLKGIEEMSHNVTAALLTLQLGTMSAKCFFDRQVVVYQYSSFALWVPYGMALGIALISLVVSVMIIARNNTGDITTSFSNTVILTRNVDEDVSAGAKLRLRAAEDGKVEYTVE